MENLTNGNYYYVICAYNDAGMAVSNCIDVVIRRTPNPFTLSSNAGFPTDDDGSFELQWTHSEFSLNYTVYLSNNSISSLNDSVNSIYNITLSFQWPVYRLNISSMDNGTYYFIVMASNEFGCYITDCLEITVEIPPEFDKENNDITDSFQNISQVLTYVAFGGLLLGLVLIYYKRKRV